MKKPYLVIMFLAGLIVALGVVRAVVHNRLSTSGIFVSKIEKEISFYETQNAILAQELLTASSLTNIEKKALKAGFTKESGLMVLKTSRSLAVNR